MNKDFDKENPLSLIELIRKKIKLSKPGKIFGGDDKLFKEIVRKSNVYGEYGCGAATDWVLGHTKAYVMASDTSKQWLGFVANKLSAGQRKRFSYNYADLGKIKDRGRPVTYEKRRNFINYTDWFWKEDRKPDTVLIDGRFRVCCFLTSLKNADKGTKIIFDDYINRPHYHLVEEFVKREDECGRQALFIVPDKMSLNLEAIEQEITNFRHVMD